MHLVALLLCLWCNPGVSTRVGSNAKPRAAALSLKQGATAKAVAVSTEVNVTNSENVTEATESRPQHFWQPTDYNPRGCVEMPSMPTENVLEEDSMTVPRCFAFCSMKRGSAFFGITEGDRCWCAAFYEGKKVNAAKCSEKCRGDDGPGCGGGKFQGGIFANIYLMFDCAENTEEEHDQILEERREATLRAYSSLSHQTCGEAEENKVKLGGMPGSTDPKTAVHVGDVEKCKYLCMHASGSEMCHGFTYQHVLQRCTFHSDVMHGKTRMDDDTDCYFKKVGLLQATMKNTTGRNCRIMNELP